MRIHLKFPFYLAVSLFISLAHAGPKDDFFKALENDAPHTVSRLLVAGLDPNLRDEQGQVGLYQALRHSSLQAADALLTHPKLDLDAVNAAGETPVMMAALRGHLEITRRLLDAGAQLHREGWTPLHYAASSPEPRVVSLLLDRGARIDARSPNGTTPLMMAARYGAIDAAELLRQRGADATLRNDLGLTAADFAIAAGRDDLAARLQLR